MRAYQRVRDGETVVLEPRRVTVHELSVTDVRPTGQHVDVDLSVRCSSGTYVRAIARDAGRGAGRRRPPHRPAADGGRARTGSTSRTPWTPSADRLVVLPIADAARAAFPSRDLDEETAASVRVGRALEVDLDGLTALFAPDGEFLALYEPRGGGARAVAVFV